MSATVAAALKKIAVALLTDKKALKTIGGIVLGVLIIIIMPIVAVVSLFNGGIEIDTDRLQTMVVENLSAEEQAKLQAVEDTMYAIEDAMLAAGFPARVKEAQVLYVLALSDFADDNGFVEKLVGCFTAEQTDAQLISAVNSAFGTSLAPEDFTQVMQAIRAVYIDTSHYTDPSTKNNLDLVQWAIAAEKAGWGYVLEDRPIANVTQGLQGAIPNLNITFDGGSPNATAQINVRGTTSLNGGSALILVDGVETNDISLLNPQDIASISVLKDASSAAVYGARAAFGVVLITTKKGTKGEKVRVNYNNNFSWSSPSRLPEGINSSKWIHAINQASVNSGGNGDFSTELVEAIDRYNSDPVNNPSVFIDQTGKYTGIGQWAYAANTNWFEEFYKKSAFMQQHNAI